MEKHKRVAFFVTALNSGGIENYLLRFLSHYKNEINALVFCKSGQLGELEPHYRALKVKITPLKLGFLNPVPYLKFYQLLREEKIDSACDFTGNYASLPLLTAKIAKITKRVAFFRGSTNHFKETKLRMFYNDSMNKLLPRVATSILSNSKAGFNFFYPELWKDNPNKYKVIYNGINAEKFITTERKFTRSIKHS